MARYRVYEKFGHSVQTRRQKVYEGEVDSAIIAGQQTLQARPFGVRYHVNGAVLCSDSDEFVDGVTCQFEKLTP